MLPAIQTPYEPEVRYMERALELAELAAAEGEVPVGAVVVHKPTGAIIGEGYNRREAAKCPPLPCGDSGDPAGEPDAGRMAFAAERKFM